MPCPCVRPRPVRATTAATGHSADAPAAGSARRAHYASCRAGARGPPAPAAGPRRRPDNRCAAIRPGCADWPTTASGAERPDRFRPDPGTAAPCGS
ncbi:hypothetical protein G6F64_015369 [Rhizopus arrhizus]|uniref:Uncharacterized protein n=1 Tax=Rhizopus oryzae TaxID=64495 RepID=A0A9P6WRM3_RHIOR|nr:hypothetical protein G6F64_015369 [Rhizopus arrhizus]